MRPHRALEEPPPCVGHQKRRPPHRLPRFPTASARVQVLHPGLEPFQRPEPERRLERGPLLPRHPHNQHARGLHVRHQLHPKVQVQVELQLFAPPPSLEGIPPLGPRGAPPLG